MADSKMSHCGGVVEGGVRRLVGGLRRVARGLKSGCGTVLGDAGGRCTTRSSAVRSSSADVSSASFPSI